jgi:hypothetical protein
VARLIPEPRSNRSAAEIFRAAWALGGLELELPTELPLDHIDLD